MTSNTKTTWDQLAQTFATSRHVSADKLIEWPAQLRLSSPFAGKRILDVGCGAGDKALYYAENSALSVLAIDPSEGFGTDWQKHQRPNLIFRKGGFDSLRAVAADQRFDMIVCFQALMYANDLHLAAQEMASLLITWGTLTVSVPHPFRFAVLRSELEGWPLGAAYQHTEAYSYPSPWKPDIYLQHPMPRISDYLNAFTQAGLVLQECEEPAPTEEFRATAPEKAEWMDRYVGIIVFRFLKPSVENG